MALKIIMDSDPGIDDAAAITMALNNPNLDVKLITAVAGNVTVDKTTANVLKLVHFFDQDVPVAAGAAEPLIKPFEDAARIHGESGMPGYDFGDDYGQPIAKTAVEALHDAIMAEDEVTLVPTGSYTNIALLFKQYPEVKSHIKQIVAMGGSISGGNMTSVAEFNVFTDPDAAAIMYNSGVPIVMVGLDVTLKALLTPATIEQLPALGETGKMLHGLITHYNDGNEESGHPMHDVNTIYYLLHPESYTTKEMWVDVQTSGPAIGATVADVRGAYHDGKTNAKVCVDIDDKAFNEWFLAEVEKIEK
ncbi:ribonucleoside hydrolase RihC [Limosilactobacillus equigenerosi]|uniref:Ribosylpyrimidine nucleosidase n=1 Tax=Limosilactobacillus equigenerosi DSM 18793 = JCM 14505 TaxID=1423742 RepID=A0A0R1UTJ5_9LACO|nr:ribonucleoside hydrolase RihC [Limosilactobacillus equigenerosi]KRL96479.1 ribosylpyrimidine nucleosidase [Limosilactobacillus equigenerosi DSM 18793 = JCM 14505]